MTRPNKGLQRKGGTADIRYSVTQSQLGGGAAPAAEPWVLGNTTAQEKTLIRVSMLEHNPALVPS
jgi:hypothetical protein